MTLIFLLKPEELSMRTPFSFLLVFLANFYAHAQLQLGNPVYSGLGCPQGSATTTLSPDASTLSVIFDQFVVEAGESLGTNFQMKNCVLRIPVQIQSGFRVALVQADFRGGISLPSAPAWSDLIVQYGWLENYGTPQLKSNFYFDSLNMMGPLSDVYFHSTPIQMRDSKGNRTGPLWSKCGVQNLHFELNSKLRVHLQGATGDGLATLDTLDTGAQDPGVEFKLQVERCQASPTPPTPPPPPRCRGRRC
jgi:hypothetical protein